MEHAPMPRKLLKDGKNRISDQKISGKWNAYKHPVIVLSVLEQINYTKAGTDAGNESKEYFQGSAIIAVKVRQD